MLAAGDGSWGSLSTYENRKARGQDWNWLMLLGEIDLGTCTGVGAAGEGVVIGRRVPTHWDTRVECRENPSGLTSRESVQGARQALTQTNIQTLVIGRLATI